MTEQIAAEFSEHLVASVAPSAEVANEPSKPAPNSTESRTEMNDVIVIARAIIEERWPQLDANTAGVLASQVVMAMDTGPDLERHVSKALTSLVNAQFPHLKKERQKRGKNISVRHFAVTDPGESSSRTDDEIITDLSLNSSDSRFNVSVQRAQQEASDLLDHAVSQITSTNRNLLIRIIGNVEPSDSYRQIADNNGVNHIQIARAFADAREAITHTARRIKRPAVLTCSNFDYSQSGVSWELCKEPHMGAVISYIGLDQRTKTTPPKRAPKREHPKPVLFTLPIPSNPKHVHHDCFGHAIVLRERETESNGPACDLLFDDGTRRTILARYLTAVEQQNSEPNQ